MKNKHYFLLLLTISLSTLFTVFAFTGADNTRERFIVRYTIGATAAEVSLPTVDAKVGSGGGV